MRIALACLLLFAPDRTYELKYRFQKGLTYVDSQTRVWSQTLFAEGKRLEYHMTHTIKVRRTILSVDDTAHPTAERVEVTHYRVDTQKSAEQKDIGLKPDPSEGKTFTWKRLKERWGLFDEKGDVSSKYTKLVGYLKNWRDARLPKKAKAIGGTWQVPAAKFLRTAGLPIPPNLQGVGLYKLESVVRGVATIPFNAQYTFRNGRNLWKVKQTGTWQFDATRGRDVSFVMQGDVSINAGKSGEGKLTLRRKVTYGP